MRLIATTQPEIQFRLFEFLTSVLNRRPRASGPILAEQATLRQLYAQADPRIVMVLRHGFDRFLEEISPDPAGRLLAGADPPTCSAAVLGLAVAAHNTLPGARLPVMVDDRQDDPVASFTQALIATVPEATSMPEMLLYHTVLRDVTPPPEAWPQEMAPLVASLVQRSPLTSLVALDGYRNTALKPLADDLLKAFSHAKRPQPNGRPSSWHEAVERIIQQPELVAWLRRQWLDVPETRRCCRHLGLILETLRRQGNCRALLLEFYEAYERCRWRTAWNGRPVRPVFDVIEELLRAQGSSDAALRLNRWGNEYLLKFLPLVEIVVAEKGVPRDYRHLTPDFVTAIRCRLQYATYNVRHKIEFTPVEFETEVRDEPG
jgi:hypothetical protein